MAQERSGAKILVDCLVEQGVEFVFGYPGGAVLPIYDELFGDQRIRHILVRHEAGAAHAAEGYARSTGKPGVVLVTSGPGATNAVTGIADAFLDSIPLVVITGQVATPLIGTDAFQEADTVGITRHCTKHNYLVKDPADLKPTLEEAFRIATTGRPGPVVVDIPKDVQVAVPSRTGVHAYQDFRSQIERLVGHVPARRLAVHPHGNLGHQVLPLVRRIRFHPPSRREKPSSTSVPSSCRRCCSGTCIILRRAMGSKRLE